MVVGRGCLGRPWLFGDLARVFDGLAPDNPPRLGAIIDIMLRHARMLSEWIGEDRAMRDFRRHASWYTKGFRGSARHRERLMRIATLRDFADLLAEFDREEPFPPNCMRVARGKTGGTQKVALPDGYLDDLDDATPPPPDAEDEFSGG